MINKILDENTKVGDIFPNNTVKIKQKYKELCKRYHPDVFDDVRAADLISALTLKYERALAMVAANTWEKENYCEFKSTKDKKLAINYLYHHTFELGEYFVCNEHVIYIFENSKKIYYNNYRNQIKNLNYSDKEMRNVFENLFPKIVAEHELQDGRHAIIISKTKDVYPLRCVIENYFEGEIPDTHLAWMISRLMNISCYLKHVNLVSNGISLDNLFVSLEHHSILLLGGWWYTTKENQPMLGTTKDIFNIMSVKVKSEKLSDSRTDVESIKAFGRQHVAAAAPKQFKNFLNEGSKSNSFQEMEKWDKALIDGYGKRRFIKLKEDKSKIYKTKGD